LREVQRNGLETSFAELERVRSDFIAHLEKNRGSEISTELNRICSSLTDFTSRAEVQVLKKEKRKAYEDLALPLYEQIEKAQALEVDKKIKELNDVYNQFLELSKDDPEICKWAERDSLVVKEQIQTAERSQTKIKKWRQPAVEMGNINPFVGYEHQIIVTIENDVTLSQIEGREAKKYPHNATIVHMDKDSNYTVVYGPKLDKIPKGDLKIIINGHGSPNGVSNRSIEEVARHVGVLNQAVGAGSRVKKISLPICCLGGEYAKRLLPVLQKEGINNTKVSVRLDTVTSWSNGRRLVTQLKSDSPGKYRSSELKETYAFNEKGDIVLVDSYTDEHYDVVLSVDKDGAPKIERTYGDKHINELQGNLKIHVKAGNFDETQKMLHQFKGDLPPGASMAHISIKTQKDNSWLSEHNALKQGQILDNFGKDFDASILMYSDPGDSQIIMATRDRSSEVSIIKGRSVFCMDPTMPKSVIELLERKSIGTPHLSYRGNAFDFGLKIKIVHNITMEEVPTIEETLKNLKLVSEVTQQPVHNISIDAPKGADFNHYKGLIEALRDKYGVKISVRSTLKNDKMKLWLSKSPGDFEVTLHNLHHLAETTPHQDTPLHNWADLSQEQINKLTTEAQKPQPSLANHDHQVLIQTEADGNVRDSTFRLAS
ncbi:C80 family cysteine peptidase, partial [Bathymodiolus thermophilus thioautotrophic gill symbiont]|uniref:C80 family cysteine peptidase n=1 Tax=Bathymodiolus thermophilus thioautotrophic gill symbiont TaxID=2360 RepID=UPI001116505E